MGFDWAHWLSGLNWQALGNVLSGATFLGVTVALINKKLVSGDNKLAFKRKDRDDVAALLREQAASCEAEKKVLEENYTARTVELDLERRRVAALVAAWKVMLEHIRLIQKVTPDTKIDSDVFKSYMEMVQLPEKVLEGVK